MDNNFDVIFIGGGPGGYVGSIRCSQLGFKVACVDLNKDLGGCCGRIGCVPSKSLLHSSEMYKKAQKEFDSLGIEFKNIKLNLAKMMSNKEKTVSILARGVEFLFKKNKITHLKGKGSIISNSTVTVTDDSGKKINYKAKHIVISTGSSPSTLPNINIDEKTVCSSTGILSLKKVPKKLCIIGGGYIGLEMGSVWSRLGSAVTVIEYLPKVVPEMDEDFSNEILKILQKQGISFELDSKVTKVNSIKNTAVVDFTNNKSTKRQRLEFDQVLVAVGRKTNISQDMTKLGIKLDNQKKIQVNDKFMTSIPNIYAIGDAIRGPALAHKASEEAIALSENLKGQSGNVNYECLASIVYTKPEIGSVGKTEQQIKKLNTKFKSSKFPLIANSRAKINHETEGFVKIIADAHSDKILGVHIVASNAGEMIAEAAIAMEFSASSEDLARTIFGHPSMSESIKESAMAIDKRAIHF